MVKTKFVADERVNVCVLRATAPKKLTKSPSKAPCELSVTVTVVHDSVCVPDCVPVVVIGEPLRVRASLQVLEEESTA